MRFHFCLLLTAAALSVPAFSQSGIMGSSATSNGGVTTGTAHFSGARYGGMTVTGAPYSAVRVTEHVQTTADGTRFTTNTQQETIYRDSQGRTRSERPMIPGMMRPGMPDTPTIVEINDPVAGFAYTLDEQNKVAHRMPIAPMPARVGGGGGGGGQVLGAMVGSAPAVRQSVPGTAQSNTNNVRPEMRQESLGTQSFDGVVAEGHRMSQTWPVGSQGNDRPFQTTNETWVATDLRVMVMSKSTDPRSGDNITRLTNISRAEPPLSMFQPPPDYKVVDETGPFEIQWTSAQK